MFLGLQLLLVHKLTHREYVLGDSVYSEVRGALTTEILLMTELI